MGTLQPKLPVVTYNDGRLLPVTFEGGQVTSTDLKDFTWLPANWNTPRAVTPPTTAA